MADLHSAGAAVDFSVLYPDGRLVDAPLPTWTHRRLLLTRDGQDAAAHGASHRCRCIRCWARTCGCRRSRSATSGRARSAPRRSRGSATTRSTTWPRFPGLPTARWRWPPRATVLGEASEVRDIRFEQMLLLDEQTPVAAVASVDGARRRRLRGGDRHEDGERARRASRGPARRRATRTSRPRTTWPPCWRRTRAAWTGPRCGSGSTSAASSTVRRSPVWPPRTPPTATVGTVLAEVALPGSIRSQQAAYGVHPALLDACFQSVAAHPDVQDVGNGGLLLPLGVRRLRAYGPTRNARYCYTRVTSADRAGVEADLDVLDEHGTVLLTVRGLRLGTGRLREQRPRSGAGRAAADHRMAAARTARRARTPTPGPGC